MSSVTVAMVVSSYEKKDGSRQIKMRITFNRKMRFLPTNIVALPSQLTKKGDIKDPVLQKQLTSLELQIYEKIQKIPKTLLDQRGVDYVVKYLSEDGKESGDIDVYKCFKYYCEHENLKPHTVQIYDNALKVLKEYAKQDVLPIYEIDYFFIEKFKEFLDKKYGKGARSVALIYSCLSAVHALTRKRYNAGRATPLISNPFEYHNRPSSPEPKHRNIPQELIQELIDKRNGERWPARRQALDLFLISFAFMGMNLVDMFNCEAPKNGILRYYRTKTVTRVKKKIEVNVKIPECIKGLYELYKDPKGKNAFVFLSTRKSYETFRRTTIKAFNAALEELGHKDEFTFYAARHSWATLCYKNKTDKGVINDGLAHVDKAMGTTEIYINKDWSVVWEANEKLLATFDWSKLTP